MRQDEGVLEGRIVSIRKEGKSMWVKVSIRGVIIEALADLVEDLRVGDRVLLHGKIVLAKLKEGADVNGGDGP